jgi:hypothetical protein
MVMPAAEAAAGAVPLALPDIQPEALPALEELNLEGSGMGGKLPASWGASPAVLPVLRQLTLRLQLLGPLLAEWARGFRRLTVLAIQNEDMRHYPAFDADSLPSRAGGRGSGGSIMPPPPPLRVPPIMPPVMPPIMPPVMPPCPQPQPQAEHWSLPAEWASGFPKLHSLFLAGMEQLSGPMPDAWQQGGFPVLVKL